MGSTRRFELGLPLFANLDMGAFLMAHAKLQAGNVGGVMDCITTLGKAGEAKAFRKLAALWNATEDELHQAEGDSAFLAALVEAQASKPFGESVKGTFDFFGGLIASLGASLGSSEAEEAASEPTAAQGDSPSADS